jgi:hypothetical protein
MNLRWRRRLDVDLRPGVEGEEWDELLAAIVAVPIVDRVWFLVPDDLSASQDQLLTTLTLVLEKPGLAVERR